MKPRPEIFEQLLQDAVWNDQQIDDRLGMALDADYWRRLLPALHIESDLQALESEADAAHVAQAVDEFVKSDTYRIPSAVPATIAARLAEAVDRVYAAGWPPAFVFMADEAWLAGRIGPLRQVMSAKFGDDYLQIPHVWAHIIRPGRHGWRPHLDEAEPGRASTWLALTEATLDNACMHLLPRSHEPSDVRRRMYDESASFTLAELQRALHGARALPARPGDMLGWLVDVVHWGGLMQPGAPERRAISFEFIARSETPMPGEQPLLPLDRLPALAARVRAVAAGILDYGAFESGRLRRFTGFAERVKRDVHVD